MNSVSAGSLTSLLYFHLIYSQSGNIKPDFFIFSLIADKQELFSAFGFKSLDWSPTDTELLISGSKNLNLSADNKLKELYYLN